MAAPIVLGTGTTASEKYLARLAKSTFLNLWAYPNTHIDKKKGGKGDGKEMCDLLVVCGDDILIFSDKSIGWQADKTVDLAWKRWFKKAIQESANQIRGATRWIDQFPDRIFLDKACQQRLPLNLPQESAGESMGSSLPWGQDRYAESTIGLGRSYRGNSARAAS
jgi:hypothetical protein